MSELEFLGAEFEVVGCTMRARLLFVFPAETSREEWKYCYWFSGLLSFRFVKTVHFISWMRRCSDLRIWSTAEQRKAGLQSTESWYLHMHKTCSSNTVEAGTFDLHVWGGKPEKQTQNRVIHTVSFVLTGTRRERGDSRGFLFLILNTKPFLLL